MKFGWCKAKRSLNMELYNGSTTTFMKGKKYHFELIDDGYFVRDHFGQLINFNKETFEDIFENQSMTNHEKLAKSTTKRGFK